MTPASDSFEKLIAIVDLDDQKTRELRYSRDRIHPAHHVFYDEVLWKAREQRGLGVSSLVTVSRALEQLFPLAPHLELNSDLAGHLTQLRGGLTKREARTLRTIWDASRGAQQLLPPSDDDWAKVTTALGAPRPEAFTRMPEHRVRRHHLPALRATIDDLWASDYDRAVMAFINALLWYNGGRWQGAAQILIEDIQWAIRGRHAGLAVLMRQDNKGHARKRRIAWRLLDLQDDLLELLRCHPGNPGLEPREFAENYGHLPLIAEPDAGDDVEAISKTTFNTRMERLGRNAMQIRWKLGPRAYRRLVLTRKSLSGLPRDLIRRSVGQVNGSADTGVYIGYDDADLEDQRLALDYHQGVFTGKCECDAPGVPMGRRCYKCGLITRGSSATDHDRLAATLRAFRTSTAVTGA